MKRKTVIISALFILGLVMTSLYSRPFVDTSSNEILLPAAGLSAPAKELANWLLREGRLNLKKGRISSAREAAVLASMLDAESGYESLISSAEKARETLAKKFARDAEEAGKAGDARKFERARSISAMFEAQM